MSKKELVSIIQNTSMALAVIVLLGFGLPQAVAYGTEIAAVEVMAAVNDLEAENNLTVENDLAAEYDWNAELDYENTERLTDFSVNLLQETMKDGENTLLSPYSVLSALAMTANGADGNTRTQMEEVFGLSVEEINEYLHTYQGLLAEDKENKLSAANSIWVKEDDSIEIREDFLETCKKWYEPAVYQTPMDESSLEEINGWVNEKTDGMIPEILNEIPDNAIMYLINALAFDAEWAKIYSSEEVSEGEFTKEDGSIKNAEFMYSEEYSYLQDEGAEGFLKYYKNGKYAFAALLPQEGTTVAEYVGNLTGERMYSILSNVQSGTVNAAIPKFQEEYRVNLSDVLQKMGMPDAFSEDNADFTKMCSCTPGEVHIGRVLHKTFMEVNERGTKAGAATAVEMLLESAAEESEPPKTVYLDRPFVYMLIDTEVNLPIFLGTAMDIGE
ncbi:MAG: serpin family protein [Eubacteriales bacterium]|nr:serpin family protein [Eubacteriales bacterium]